MAGNKRKAKAETNKPAAATGNTAGGPAAQTVPPPKKHKGIEERDATQADGPILPNLFQDHAAFPPAVFQADAAFPPTLIQADAPAGTLLPAFTFTSTSTPARPADVLAKQPTDDVPNASVLTRNLLTQALQSNPEVLPNSTPTAPATVISTHIDNLANAMWQVAFHNNPMLQQGSTYSAMFSQRKLAALAKLNYLPSWWFFREMAVKMLTEDAQYVVDDESMNATWTNVCRWCQPIMDRQKQLASGRGGEGVKKDDRAEK